jgi:hypothetical protein
MDMGKELRIIEVEEFEGIESPAVGEPMEVEPDETIDAIDRARLSPDQGEA